MSESWTREEASAQLIDRAKDDLAAFGEIYDLYAELLLSVLLPLGAGIAVRTGWPSIARYRGTHSIWPRSPSCS